MSLSLKRPVKNLFQKYRIRPKKRLGQNFLISKPVIKKIIQSANLNKKDIVLEIGPGIGTLTSEIAKKVKKVIAIEKDPKMIEILKETLKGLKNVQIIQGDILKIQDLRLKTKDSYKIVSNLPFYLTAPVIRKFLEVENLPKQIVLIIQKELAQRITAHPPHSNLLSVSVQFYSKPKIISYVSKKSFWPQPKVDSAIIELKVPLRGRQKSKVDKDLFFRIVKAGFTHPRKQILNNLAKSLKLNKEEVKNWLLKNKIQPTLRAENLILKDWINLTKNFKIKQW